MKKQWPETYEVNDNEPSCLLKEFNKDLFRWQEVYVVRNDVIAVFTDRMGLTSQFDYGPINIIGGNPETNEIFETVASLRDIANTMRDEGEEAAPVRSAEEWADAYQLERIRREDEAKGTIWSPRK